MIISLMKKPDIDYFVIDNLVKGASGQAFKTWI
jgi:N-acetyl-gamma-glutamylphosphate reductase